jgi:cobalt-zinc-cadmium efflux system outer membrane protein
MFSSIEINLRRSGGRRDLIISCERCLVRLKALGSSSLAGLLLVTLVTPAILAQEQSAQQPLNGINADNAEMIRNRQQTSAARRSITISDAVSIFLQQNLELVAARYDVDTADAEKLTARLRPNPQISIDLQTLSLNLTGPFFSAQQYTYSLSQTFELAGKRRKRIDVANANADVARAQFQTAVWQMTNDLKKKFYAVVLADTLVKLAKANQTTFTETLNHTTELFRAGEISGLDLRRLEVEKLKFDTDVANSERDYQIALRDLRVTLGGDYRAMDIEVVGTLDYQPYQFSLADLRDKSLGARPDLKAAQLSERAADFSIQLQDAQRVPDLTLGAGVNQVPSDISTYTFGIGMALPVYDRNQGERVKALIQKKKAQNDQKLLTNQVLSDVDKALTAFEIQKKRVELYRTGVLTKVDDILNLTEFSLRAGESSTLELLDAIRTRRETLASYYQTLFDYQSSLLDLELATATPHQK